MEYCSLFSWLRIVRCFTNPSLLSGNLVYIFSDTKSRSRILDHQLFDEMRLITSSSNPHKLITPVVSYHHLTTNLNTSTTISLRVVKNYRFWGFKVSKKLRTRSGILCKESDSELVLEGEILEFMKISRSPNDFPTKKELLDAGRIDLVDAIIKKGGWMLLGWDDSDDESGCDSNEFDDIRDLNSRFDPALTCCSSSHQCASSSGRSLETVINEDAWIEGAIYRLENLRTLSFGTSMQEDGHCICDFSKVNDGQSVYGSLDVDLTAIAEKSNRHEDIDSNDIRSRLQQMKLELSSSFRLLRFTTDKNTNNLPNAHKRSSSQLRRLRDTENEDINIKDRLKSVCAKLAVLEGKLGSSIIDAQKLVEKKQTRTDGECKSLQLHNICIIWHDSASEVFLVGSIDGWTTQRKMKTSESGVFYLSLKLYPGRYQYKFIVDGVWRIDGLRPIVNDNGYENNLLIIPE